MAEEKKKIAVVERETKEQPGECCVPECGPTTCEPGAEATVVEAKVADEPTKPSSGCGPPCS